LQLSQVISLGVQSVQCRACVGLPDTARKEQIHEAVDAVKIELGPPSSVEVIWRIGRSR
jgi:hypothetical protein